MNIRKTLLPLALAATAAIGTSTFVRPTNANDKTIQTENVNKPQVDEKQVFDYMKYSSIPINENKGVNLAMSLFGLGLAGVKRKEEVLQILDKVESIADKSSKFTKSIITSGCKDIREMIVNSQNLELNQIPVLKQRVDSLSYFLESDDEELYKDFQRVVELLNGDFTQTNEEYKKECLKEVDGIKDSLRTISVAPKLGKDNLETHINSLRRLIMEGESDYKEHIGPAILRTLQEYEDLLENSSLMSYDEFVVEGYKRIVWLPYNVERYTSLKSEWDMGNVSVKNRYPQIWNHQENTEEYAKFANQVLNDCKDLKQAVKIQEIRQVEPLVRKIKANMLNYGTYNNDAFANAMYLCDYILSSHIDSQGKAYNLGSLTTRVKALLENVYRSVKSPKKGPYENLPNNFNEWEFQKKSLENFQKLDITKIRKGAYQPASLREIQQEMEEENAIKKSNAESDKKENKIHKRKITFADVGGQDKAIELLKKKVLYPVRYPNAFNNRMISHGIIMFGRPGTGKTLMALALSNEAKANFIKINASELTTSLHGETDKNWRDLFKEAREKQPCIIFIDEFDTVAQKRGHNATNNYDDTVLNTILTEMSDVEKNGDNVFVIGATNRFEVLDSGILRAGRFGTHIELKAPESVKDVLQIFDIHTKDVVIDNDVDKTKLAEMMLKKNVTGSDIASIVNEALENTFLRLGIYEKMEDGSFDDNDLSYIKTTMEDFLTAIDNYEVIIDKSAQKRNQIGFNQR